MSKEILLIGVFYPDEEKEYGRQLNEIIKPELLKWGKSQKWYLSLLVRLFKNKGALIFMNLIRAIDNRLIDKLGNEFKLHIRDFIIAVTEMDTLTIERSGGALISMLVNVPHITKDTAARFFSATLKMIIEFTIDITKTK